MSRGTEKQKQTYHDEGRRGILESHLQTFRGPVIYAAERPDHIKAAMNNSIETFDVQPFILVTIRKHIESSLSTRKIEHKKHFERQREDVKQEEEQMFISI